MKTLHLCRTGALPLPKTAKGADRQWQTLMNQYRRCYAGGGMFGFDWRTLRINEPELYEHLKQLEKIT